jgi:hypothetical protein
MGSAELFRIPRGLNINEKKMAQAEAAKAEAE